MKRSSTIILILLSGLFLNGCHKPENGNELPPDKEPVQYREMPDVQNLVKKASVIKEVVSCSTTTLTGGVQETDFTVTLTNGMKENIFIISADLDRDSIFARVALPSMEKPTGEWPRRTLSTMAYALDLNGGLVIAMINADFWNTTTFVPKGPVHCNGQVISSTFQPSGNKQGISYVSCSSEDKMNIDYSASYSADGVAFPNVTGSGIMLTWDGKQVDNSSWPADDRHPRTAIGYTKDGFVYFFCVDGRNAGVSEGMTYDEMGSIFEALGCDRAVNLDGGGSTQLLVRNPSTDKFETRNKPSDGSARAVINAWVIMEKM